MAYSIEIPEGDEENYEIEFSPPSKVEDVGKQLGIGGARGLGTYGNILDLIRAQTKERQFPGQKALTEAEFEAPESILPFLQDDDVLPHYSRLPSGKEVEDFLQQLGIDTEPYTPSGKTARRVGEGTVGAATILPDPTLIAAGAIGGGVGGLTEELTGSELAGDIAEIVTNIAAFLKKGPAAVGKRAEKIKALEGLGFSRKEMTLLSQGEGKLEFLGKLASKDGKMSRLFEQIYAKHGNLYDGLRAASEEFGHLTGKNSEKLTNSIVKAFGDLTPGQQEIVEKLVSKFQSQPVNFKTMMDFIHDMNMKFGTVKGGKKAVLKLKQPVMEAMKDLSPEAGQVFEELQGSYKDFKKIAKRLRPGNLDEILDLGELLGMAKGIINLPADQGGLIMKTLGVTGARKLAREFLINPDLQGIMIRIAKAMREGKTVLAQNLVNKIQKKLPKESSEQPTKNKQSQLQ
jgi:hypothetical protein